MKARGDNPVRSEATLQPWPAQRRPRNSDVVMTVFGTRPEIIKLAPVIHALEEDGRLRTINVCSSQHTDLLVPFLARFDVRVDFDLKVMSAAQTPNEVCARVLAALGPILVTEQPGVVVVQGDTTTALGAALAAFHCGIPVAHVEAGLRSGNRQSPFPEEMNRRLITRLASWHFAATERNRENLLAENVDDRTIFVTGNPVIDALQSVMLRESISPALRDVLQKTAGKRRIVLTTHRRESFGEVMRGNLRVLCEFIRQRPDVALIFPVHPNPAVAEAARQICQGCDRVYLLKPLGYEEFIGLLSRAWLVVSDSGGVQEEVATLKKPLLILRENTERPEALACGIARLVPGPDELALRMEAAFEDRNWEDAVRDAVNPFGSGDAGTKIASHLAEIFHPVATRQQQARA